jgi:hypothetical protein
MTHPTDDRTARERAVEEAELVRIDAAITMGPDA